MRPAPVGLVALLTLLLAAQGHAHAAGRFAVGVTTLTFTKASVTTGAPRPMPTVVWYPAVPRSGIPETLGRRDAAVRRGRFPLILFSHGSCGRPTAASYLTTALARQGFVVAALPHPGNTADDPGCVAAFIDSFVNRVPDIRFVLDAMLAQADDPSSRFHRRLRTDAIGVSGLSFGGFTALLAAQREPRLVAALALVPGGAVALDRGGISVPTLVIGSEGDIITPFPESEAVYGLVTGPRFLVELLGGNHLSVVDDCGGVLCGDIPQDDAHRLVLRYALPFMRRYLRNERGAGRKLVRSVPGVMLTAEPQRAPGSARYPTDPSP